MSFSNAGDEQFLESFRDHLTFVGQPGYFVGVTWQSGLTASRRVLLAGYAVGYVIWFWRYGLIIDRISVLISVAVLLVIAHVGRPWRSWRRLSIDLLLYAAMWIGYDETRGVADRIGMPLQVESVRNIDRALFFGTDPTVWLQAEFYSRSEVRWYDVLASLVYYSHFVVPIAVIATLWIWKRDEWVRFMKRFATTLAVACSCFILLPTAPPWMAGGGDRKIRLHALPSLRRPAGRGWTHLGFESFVHAWETGRDWANPVAAMPSLHAGYSLLITIFFWSKLRTQRVHGRSLGGLAYVLVVYPLTMGVALVYLAEHYVVDVLAGWALVIGVCWLWSWIEHRHELVVAPHDTLVTDDAHGTHDAGDSVTPPVHDVSHVPIH